MCGRVGDQALGRNDFWGRDGQPTRRGLGVPSSGPEGWFAYVKPVLRVIRGPEHLGLLVGELCGRPVTISETVLFPSRNRGIEQ